MQTVREFIVKALTESGMGETEAKIKVELLSNDQCDQCWKWIVNDYLDKQKNSGS